MLTDTPCSSWWLGSSDYVFSGYNTSKLGSDGLEGKRAGVGNRVQSF